ncbi:MAG: mechanosensitive ion channel [candidate division Zixibacteria bacterium]|nr:mechanosensitive ion channel [candidate division Zixibacteria bacterium]
MEEISWLESIRAWIVEKGPAFAVDVLVFLLIIIIGKIIISAIVNVLRKALMKSGRVNEMLQKFAVDISRKVMWVIVLMVALPRLGIDIAPLIAGLGVAGFVIGFAFQESLGNLAAGVMILVNQPFTTGHYVEAGGHAGSVTELNLMATTMLTPDNRKIVIPNRAIWGGSIVNYSAMDTRRIDLVIGIGYSSPIGKARDILMNILNSEERVLKDPAPTIEVIELADSSVNFVYRPWCKTGDYWPLRFYLMRAVKEEFDKEGIEIPFPQTDVHLHQVESA